MWLNYLDDPRFCSVKSLITTGDLFGAKLSNTMGQPADVLANFGTDRPSMLAIGVPLMIVAAIATHFTSRHSVQRQTTDAAANPQTAVMNRMVLWVFPMFAIIGGPFLPLAILVYWLANNCWTLVQQRIVYRRIDREEAEAAVADGTTGDGSADSSPPAVVESESVSSDAAEATGRSATAADQPGDAPGVIENRSRDEQSGESR